MSRIAQPDFLIIGAPKAGTTALHAALAGHPDVFVSNPKEPKYWLCDGAPPPAWCGPGDRHSQQEWIWRADEYTALFDGAGEHKARGESTAVLPLEPRRPPADRRGPARGATDRGRARPHRPCLQQLDAPVVRRPRAGAGLRDGVRPPGRAGGGRLGAVLALPRAGAVRRAARAPPRPRRRRPGPGAALPRPDRRPAHHRRPSLPLPRDPRGSGRLPPAGQLAQLRPAGLAVTGVRPGDPRPAPGSASSPRPACGARPACR